jgi:mediator of RNA polymerase II transcription subunit 14
VGSRSVSFNLLGPCEKDYDANVGSSIYESDAYRLSDCRPLPTRTNSHRQPPLSPESFMQIQHFAARAISMWEANKTLVRLNIPSAIRQVEYGQEDRSSNETVEQSTPKTLPALCVRFTSLLKDFTGKNQFAADLLQISYIGFDTDVGTVKLLAKGMMRKPGRLKEILQRTRDDDVTFNASGSFSLVLKTGLGRSCVDRLVAQLRTIGRLCNFADVLKQRGLECKDISLSRVVFAYAEGLEVELRFTGSDTTPIKLAIPSDNPHRRIASLLEAIVNSGSDGFRNFTAALQFTLPLLTAFDTIENRHLSFTPNLPVMHSRNVDHFRLAYLNPPCAFEFKLKQTRDVLEWVIQEMISTPARDERSKTYPTINEKLKEVFKSVGDGWTGKNSMIVADVKAIGEPLLRLDDVVKGCIKTESMSPRTGAQDGPDVVVLD